MGSADFTTKPLVLIEFLLDENFASTCIIKRGFELVLLVCAEPLEPSRVVPTVINDRDGYKEVTRERLLTRNGQKVGLLKERSDRKKRHEFLRSKFGIERRSFGWAPVRCGP